MGKRKLKVILDTNVLVSSILFGGEFQKILDSLKANKFSLIFSKDTFQEFVKVLHYPKFKLTEEEIESIIAFYVLPYSKIIDDITIKLNEDVCRDKHDIKFLELVLSAKADYLITGDKDILEIKNNFKFKILTPKEFIKILD